MKDRSMTRQLILWLAAAITAFWLLATGLGVLVMQDEFGEIFDSSLQETAERLMPLVIDDLFQREGLQAPRRLEGTAATEAEEKYLTYQVRNAEGHVLLHSHDETAAPFPAPLKQGFWENEAYRIYTVSAVDGTVFVQVADRMAHRHEAAMEGGLALFLPIFLLVPLSILVVWLIVRRMIAPINDLRQAIARKDSGNLEPIEFETLPRELRPIGRSVNRLLSRLRAAFDAEREFTANSAHELRTPIAGALAQTQLLIAELRSGPAKTRARQIEASLANLGRLAEKLLQLARAEAGIGTIDDPVDLASVLELVVNDFERSASAPGRIRYQRDPGTTLVRPVSQDAFAIVVRNLIENALVHGKPDEPVEIRLERNGMLRVINGAAPLTEAELQAFRQRFARGKTGSPGSGLGLSIAERLAHQMNGRLELFSPVAGRNDGFEARFTLDD
ncbi:HAMP domain-containing sensor histidine kinase [Sinorhizobium sp. BG8]|uniref:sensor histidine kinase n=1 Tax=Sinorhizobium sp. BG8 TaxID=2613773 RepID=UPI00193D0D7E|nr:HAMP domain-containing sensor histidine kinase [Sinorhizobium sp. BG8]QRM56553.1 HAMP domain-containing histidine kinase [Sinorhizobium sp. BG8]